MRRRYRGHKANRSGKISVIVIVLAMISVMSVQIVNLYKKDRQYMAQESSLEEQKEAEMGRQAELEEYEAYTKTQEYVEDIAKSKLGLVYDGDIIFKEQ